MTGSPGPGGAARWALAAAALAALLLGLQALPPMLFGAGRWNWAGHALALAALAGVAWALRSRIGLTAAAMGFTRRPAPGRQPAAAGVTLAMLAWQAVAVLRLPAPADVTAEDLWFQATMPGLFEEALFRGLLLALLDRAWPPRWRVAGVDLGWGGVAVTVAFVALHATSFASIQAVAPLALALLWLRGWTGGLVWPVFLHNAWNVLAFALRA